LLIAILVVAVLVSYARRWREIGTLEAVLLVHMLVYWLAPQIIGRHVSIYPAESALVPMVGLLRPWPPPPPARLLVLAAVLGGAMSYLFFATTLVGRSRLTQPPPQAPDRQPAHANGLDVLARPDHLHLRRARPLHPVPLLGREDGLLEKPVTPQERRHPTRGRGRERILGCVGGHAEVARRGLPRGGEAAPAEEMRAEEVPRGAGRRVGARVDGGAAKGGRGPKRDHEPRRARAARLDGRT